MKIRPLLGLVVLTAFTASACEVLGVAPPPATAVPTATPTPAAEATATPTLGPREFLDAVYCWKSPIDEGEFNLLRFFNDGAVIDATVQPFSDCAAAWAAQQQYMTIDNIMAFGHGEYFMSGDIIRFELAAPNSTQVVGDASGVFDFSTGMLNLTKGGATQEYILVGP